MKVAVEYTQYLNPGQIAVGCYDDLTGSSGCGCGDEDEDEFCLV